MARQRNKLNDKQIKSLNEEGRYNDGGNLYLQVTKTGTKSWLFVYKIANRRRMMGMGSYPDLSLAAARLKASEFRRQLIDGVDVLAARKEERKELRVEMESRKTFEWCAREYMRLHQVEWKNSKHRDQWSSTLETYAFPVIGRLAVSEIKTQHMAKILSPIWHKKWETAKRVRGRIEKILDWAKVLDYRSGENPAVWRGNLEHILPKKSANQQVRHHPALPYSSIPRFISELRLREGVSAKALEFTILCAARTGEILGARWDEMDTQNGVWRIPAERMKAGLEHRVPLSRLANVLIQQLHDARSSDFVFTRKESNRPLSDMVLLQLLKRMGWSQITVHGFRSTFRDWAAEKTSHPGEAVEKALAHAIGGVERAYRRGDLLEKRRSLMEDWSAYCDGKPFTADIIPMRGRS